MKKNTCYCDSISEDELRLQGIPEGYCGFCQICKAPGHIQFFPGVIPYTGSWCDYCFAKLKRRQNFRIVCFILLVLIIGYFLFFR